MGDLYERFCMGDLFGRFVCEICVKRSVWE